MIDPNLLEVLVGAMAVLLAFAARYLYKSVPQDGIPTKEEIAQIRVIVETILKESQKKVE